MKKLCYITTVSGTLSAFIVKSAEFLARTGEYDITLICDEDPEFAKTLSSMLHYIPVHMSRGIKFDALKAINSLYRVFKYEKFDLVQYSTPNASLYASIAAKMAGIPIRLYCQWGLLYVGFSGLKRELFKTVEKLICFLSTWIEPDSNSNLAFAHQEGLYPKNKGSVIWNGSASGVDLKKFDISRKEEYGLETRQRLGIGKNSFIFGFVGRITRDKGINELLGAMQELIEEYTNTYLILVGSEEIGNGVDQELYRWAKNCNKILFCGATHTVEKYISAMDCFVMPSYREGFGTSVIEAEAMGVPVIVTDIPGPRDAILEGETGIVVKKQDMQELKNAMIGLLNNKKYLTTLSKAGSTFIIENFEQGKLFEHIYEDRRRLFING